MQSVWLDCLCQEARLHAATFQEDIWTRTTDYCWATDQSQFIYSYINFGLQLLCHPGNKNHYILPRVLICNPPDSFFSLNFH